MNRNKIRRTCACQLFVVVIALIPDALASLSALVPQRDATTKSDEKVELVVVLPSPDAFQRHINAEFWHVTGLLEDNYGWQRRDWSSLKRFGMLIGADKRASFELPLLNTRATANAETLFVLKFHWDYDVVIKLGKGPREHTP